MKEWIRTILLPIIAALIWGIAFVAQKENTSGALSFNAARCAIAFVILMIVVAIMEKGNLRRVLVGYTKEETKAMWIGGFLCGFALALAIFLQQYGLDGQTEAGKAGFLTAMYIVLVPVFGLFLHKRVGVKVWLSVVIAVIGLFFLCIKTNLDFRIDDLVVLSCSAVFSIQILLVDYFSPKCNPIKLSYVQFLACTVYSALVGIPLEHPEISSILSSLLPILYLGIFSSGVGYTLQIIAQRGSNPTIVSLLFSLESVFSTLAGAVLLHEALTVREYLGCALILIAIVLCQIPNKKPIKEGAAK